MIYRIISLYLVFLVWSPAYLSAQEEPQKRGSKPFAKVELTSNLVEDGYSQTSGTFGLLTDVGYKWEQFEIGVRGNNVYFDEERAHLTLQPHLAIISNFSPDSRFFIEHEERFYFNSSTRNGGRSSLGLDIGEIGVRYESLTNWWGLEIGKSRWSFNYIYYWDVDLSSDFQVGYNIVGEANTPAFFDASGNIKYKKDTLEYYAELILLSSVVPYIPGAQAFTVRLGVITQF